MAELILEIAFALLGATVGVIWPPKTRAWARWQIWGVALGVLALLSFGVAYLAAQFVDGSSVVWPAIIVGLISLIGYGIMGNVCRRFHEQDSSES